MANIQADINRQMAKLPHFFGENNSRNNITTINFIARVESAKTALNWSDTQTYHLAILSMQGEALSWLNTMRTNTTKWEENWASFKLIFFTEFGLQEHVQTTTLTSNNTNLQAQNGKTLGSLPLVNEETSTR